LGSLAQSIILSVIGLGILINIYLTMSWTKIQL
jgi:hypothetical protein